MLLRGLALLVWLANLALLLWGLTREPPAAVPPADPVDDPAVERLELIEDVAGSRAGTR